MAQHMFTVTFPEQWEFTVSIEMEAIVVLAAKPPKEGVTYADKFIREIRLPTDWAPTRIFQFLEDIKCHL